MAMKMGRTKAMRQYESRLHSYIPGCEDHEPDSDAYWVCAFRTYSITLWHYSGTCEMGREDDSIAIVNTGLQVKYTSHETFIMIVPTVFSLK